MAVLLPKKCIVLVVGLPASGKSYYAYAKVEKLKTIGLAASVLDDPRTPEDLRQGLHQFKHGSSQILYVTDPYLCKQEIRLKAHEMLINEGFLVRAVYFENNPQQCVLNAANRPSKEVTSFIWLLSKVYRPGRPARKVHVS